MLDAVADQHVEAHGPRLDAELDREHMRVGGELGALHRDEGSSHVDMDFGAGELETGSWQSETGTQYGVRAQGSAASLDVDHAGYGMDGSVLGGGLEATAGPDGVALGAGASLAELSVSTNPEGNPHSNHDTNVRFGMGVGPGLGGRLHTTDVDGDSAREVGFGADIGPFSFDVTTEVGEGTPERKQVDRAANRSRRAAERRDAEDARRMQAPRAASRPFVADRESALDTLANRTGRDRHVYMTLGPDGEWQEHPREIARDVRAFQREHQLPESGELDETTMAALSRS